MGGLLLGMGLGLERDGTSDGDHHGSTFPSHPTGKTRHGAPVDAATTRLGGRFCREDAHARRVGAGAEPGTGLRAGGGRGGTETAADRRLGACEECARDQEGIDRDRGDGLRHHLPVRVAEGSPLQRLRRSRVPGPAICSPLRARLQVPERRHRSTRHGGGTLPGGVGSSLHGKVGRGVDRSTVQRRGPDGAGRQAPTNHRQLQKSKHRAAQPHHRGPDLLGRTGQGLHVHQRKRRTRHDPVLRASIGAQLHPHGANPVLPQKGQGPRGGTKRQRQGKGKMMHCTATQRGVTMAHGPEIDQGAEHIVLYT
eukprot:scaffold73_cov337-Pavlova_lutheri.AAC.6